MPDWLDGARIVLTGASSGIGLALARQVHDRSAKLIATARRAPEDLPDDFPDLPDGSFYVPADLASETGLDSILATVGSANWEGIDALILNAGAGRYRPIEDERLVTIQEIVDINLWSAIHLTHRLYEKLAAVQGRVVLVGSVAHRGASGFPVYAATKSALNGFARALRSEWQDEIAVQVVHPGATATAMHARSGYDPGGLRRTFMAPDAVAAAILRRIEGGRSPVTITWAALARDRLRPRS